jgi:transcriptional regulator with XRE-family HTH domain
LSISIKTPQEVQAELARRFKARRLALDLTQEGLADRSGVNWSSLKRFERTGLIALDSLLRLALVLDCLGDFDGLCPVDGPGSPLAKSLDQLLAERVTRRKGRIK